MSTTDDLVFSPQQGKSLTALVREQVWRAARTNTFSLNVMHTSRLVTQIANGRVLSNVDGDYVWVSVDFDGGRAQATFNMGYIPDEETLRDHIAHAFRTSVTLRPWNRALRLSPSYEAQPIPTSNIWKPSTATAMLEGSSARETALPAVFDVIDQAKLIGAGMLTLTATARYVSHSGGLEAYARETDSRLSVRAIAQDGTSAGWAGSTARDWNTVTPVTVARNAVNIAMRARQPVALEPGRRTVVLSATAVGQLLSTLSGAFDARAAEMGVGIFARGPRSRVGERVIDPRLKIWSDPNDPMGGNMPFFGDGRDNLQRDSVSGFPVTPQTLIERGVLTNLVYGMGYGTSVGKSYNRWPFAFHVAAMPDVPTSTVDEMIANCTEGIYVNRFSQLELVDLASGQVTGVTRDGCFLIKNGKITKPIKNLRVLESPIFMLNQVQAIGVPERVMVDESPWTDTAFPIITPPIMANDFNFSALCDAV